MRADQLLQQRVQRIEPAGVLYEPWKLVVWGIHGGNDFIIGVRIGDTFLQRRGPDPITGAPRETIDALRERAMRDVVPTLPPEALRDSKGSAVGYFVYEGLAADHCRPIAYEEGAL